MAESSFTPREIVSELDRYIIGQSKAKRAVAIALRNRWRRLQVNSDLRDEITPKNIIMIGPTGVGKTEIARRLSKLAKAPFVKVEASKFTEVGYVGKDVESMIRDLTELAIKMVREEEMEKVTVRAQEEAEERLLDLLVPSTPTVVETDTTPSDAAAKVQSTREKFRKMLREGKLDDREVELKAAASTGIPMVEVFTTGGLEEMGRNLRDMLGNMSQGPGQPRKVKVKDAKRVLAEEEAARLVDMEQIRQRAVERVEQNGIVFLDEIDKIAGREGGHGPEISREGVQRDILPIVEGSTVSTKYGMVKTDHILFVASGAFHVSKPSDLIPELQGRFPIRVELDPLTEEDFYKILTQTDNSLIKQYEALLETEGVRIVFETDGIREICRIAALVNDKMENIGARRLHTILERLLEDISYSASENSGSTFTVNQEMVRERLSDIVQDEDLRRYIL